MLTIRKSHAATVYTLMHSGRPASRIMAHYADLLERDDPLREGFITGLREYLAQRYLLSACDAAAVYVGVEFIQREPGWFDAIRAYFRGADTAGHMAAQAFAASATKHPDRLAFRALVVLSVCGPENVERLRLFSNELSRIGQ